MAAEIPNGETATVELNDEHVRWVDLSLSPSTRYVKPWIQHVTDTHPDYRVTGDWLDSQSKQGDVCFDVSGLERDDLLKVSGATGPNRKSHAYYRVAHIDGTRMDVERLSEDTVIQMVTDDGDDETDEAAQVEPATEPVQQPDSDAPLEAQVRTIRDQLSALADSESANDARVSMSLAGTVNELETVLERIDE